MNNATKQIDSLARHRLVSIIIVGFLSFGGSWAFAQFRGIPVPYVQDEFSYLLAADTFAHGRLTNPTPPMWENFETYHELMRPTYMSKYPPGQGLFLALGQVIFGHPIYGVWLSDGLMCAAICWMLYAWVSPRWALVGGLVSVLQFGIFTYWSQSYMGGAVAALGGALVFGALPRIAKNLRFLDTLLLGLGLGILANTRPIEGIFIGIPLGILLLPWKTKWRLLDKPCLTKNFLLPLSLFIILIITSTGAYNKAITGNALMFPHILHSKQYDSAPMFLWQPPYPPVHYNHKILYDFEQKNWLHFYLVKRTWQGFTQDFTDDGLRLFMYFFGFPLALPSLGILIRLFFQPKTSGRYFFSLGIILLMMVALTVPAKPHYISSLTCLAVLLITNGLRKLFLLKFPRKRFGGALILLLISLQLSLNIVLTPLRPTTVSLAQSIPPTQFNVPGTFTREELKKTLTKRGGKYLVIVQYPDRHNIYLDWVYNDADIAHAPIVWARGDLGQARNAQLINYFKDRQFLFIYIVWDKYGFITSYSNRQ